MQGRTLKGTRNLVKSFTQKSGCKKGVSKVEDNWQKSIPNCEDHWFFQNILGLTSGGEDEELLINGRKMIVNFIYLSFTLHSLALAPLDQCHFSTERPLKLINIHHKLLLFLQKKKRKPHSSSKKNRFISIIKKHQTKQENHDQTQLESLDYVTRMDGQTFCMLCIWCGLEIAYCKIGQVGHQFSDFCYRSLSRMGADNYLWCSRKKNSIPVVWPPVSKPHQSPISKPWPSLPIYRLSTRLVGFGLSRQCFTLYF